MIKTLPSPDEMYQALLQRDPAWDGLFVVGVRTTGIFCRPVCPARKPRRENVEFFADPREALLAGYRPCRLCRPVDGAAARPQWVTRVIDAIEHEPAARLTDQRLRELAIEPVRARRYFKRHFGMTVHGYARARRMGSALSLVRNGRAPGRAAHHAGYASESGFREAFAKVFGVPPGKAGGVAALLAEWIDTPLGPMLAVASERGLCLLEFVDRRALQSQIEAIRRRFSAAITPGDNDHLRLTARQVAAYFAGELRRFTVPLDQRGTPFQRNVWDALRRIPHGETRSYADIARQVGSPGAVRAVGRANGQNPLAIIVPCHRVVRADGTLCGYGGGVWRKQWLLEHERGATARR